jgi:hypothetical protein
MVRENEDVTEEEERQTNSKLTRVSAVGSSSEKHG